MPLQKEQPEEIELQLDKPVLPHLYQRAQYVLCVVFQAPAWIGLLGHMRKHGIS